MATQEQVVPGPRAAPRVLRNASLLVIAQVLAAPISILVNAVAARALGAKDFGLVYQAATFTSFTFLFVEWGQPSALTAQVAVHRPQAGVLLGSGLALRLGAAALACLGVPLVCALVGYERDFVIVLTLALLASVFGTVSGACQDVLRGYERTDFAASTYLGWQLLSAMAVVPTLLLGGGLRGMLIAQLVCAALGMGFVLWMLPRLRVPRPAARWSAMRALLRSGQPFLLFGLVLMLQPMIDAAMLSAFAVPEAMGWYAAARKLVGVLTYPAAALIAALYPTLCRLRSEDMEAFRSTAAEALYTVTVVVVPLSLGCGLFPDIGVAIFGQRYFGESADDLRMLAPFVFLVYFSMPIGSCLASSGRQMAWTMVQLGCVLVSVSFDPMAIRWLQAHTGNGSLGVCLTTVASEILMVIGGLVLLPPGILRKLPLAKMGAVVLAGSVMAGVALWLSQAEVIVRAGVAVLAYLGCLLLFGGASLGQLRALPSLMRRR